MLTPEEKRARRRRGQRETTEPEAEPGKPATDPQVLDPASPKKRSAWPFVLIGTLLGAGLVGGYQLFRNTGPKNLTVRSFATPTRKHWLEQGFVEMVPPIRLPSQVTGKSLIEIWMKFPQTGKITSRFIPEQKRAVLVYPPGLVADRLELINDNVARIVDVRGTEIGEGTTELFHVYRRKGPGLSGFEWHRGNVEQQDEATRVIVDQMRSAEQANDRDIATVKINNDCGPCHAHDLPARTISARGHPNRATDGAGFFAPQTVLSNRAPLEYHRPRDMNVDDQFVKFHCGADDHEATLKTRPDGTKWPTCEDNAIPIAELDMKSALAANDEHAKRVCDSRRALFDHMDDGARKAFASAFQECSIAP